MVIKVNHIYIYVYVYSLTNSIDPSYKRDRNYNLLENSNKKLPNDNSHINKKQKIIDNKEEIESEGDKKTTNNNRKVFYKDDTIIRSNNIVITKKNESSSQIVEIKDQKYTSLDDEVLYSLEEY